ncbi:hypothetical protein D041_4156A, partial [Vibrio parahaemolyticus EKP-008]
MGIANDDRIQPRLRF